MTARPQDVALLPDLDEWLRGCPDPSKVSPEWLVKKPSRLLWRCRDALASAQAREDQLRAEVERFRTAYHDGTLLLESAERAAAEAVNARESAQRDADRYRYIQRMWTVRLLNGGVVMRNAFGIEAKDSAEIDRIIDAALSTNAATQTGERNG